MTDKKKLGNLSKATLKRILEGIYQKVDKMPSNDSKACGEIVSLLSMDLWGNC